LENSSGSKVQPAKINGNNKTGMNERTAGGNLLPGFLDRAKGILMDDHGFSEPEAYKRMRSMAMSKGKRMAEIAEAIIFAKELSA